MMHLLLAALAVQLPPADPILMRDHVRAARHERVVAALDAWIAARTPPAPPELLPPEGRPTAPADLAALARVRRELSGETSDGDLARRLGAVADALDLRVIPGVFATSAEEGDTVPMEVRVAPIGALAEPIDVELSLVWVSPTGREERARTEPVGHEALRGRVGFTMYVRSPSSARAARWHLVPLVRSADAIARGAAVPVECVARLSERLAVLRSRAAGEDGDEVASDVVRWIEALEQEGLRRVRGPDALLAEAERRLGVEVEGEREGPRLLGRAFSDPVGASEHAWSVDPAGGVERTLVVFTPSAEAPEALLSGPAAWAEWQRFADGRRCRVIATACPFPFGPEGGDGRGRTTLPRFVSELQALSGDGAGPVHALALGDGALRLRLGLRLTSSAPFDGIAWATAFDPEDPGFDPQGIPQLALEPRLHADGAPLEAPGVLPGWVDGWLTELDGRRREDLEAGERAGVPR